MNLALNGKRVFCLGDPHLGKAFVHGVPLDRRGEREKLVWRDFEAALGQVCDLHVCMGDLFDKWMVSYDTLIRAAEIYLEAARQNPDTTYVVLKGNHDWVRDLEKSSAFDVFKTIVGSAENVVCVTEPKLIEGFLFYPWHPSNVAREVVASFDAEVCFGHFDTEFGEHNMVPTGCGIPLIITGHVHKPDEFVRDTTTVKVVGSMQPYAHGEEPNDDLYITVTLDELDNIETKNRCVRVLLQPDEFLDRQIDCLQLTIKKLDDTKIDDTPSVSLGDFDMDYLFKQVFEEAGVLPEITEKLLAQYHERKVETGA